MRYREVNFDGLVGPTHHYGGLAHGNLASARNRHEISSPRRAALEGIAKMKLVAGLGVPQAVLPPHERPDLRALRRLGFTGADADVIARAGREDPWLLAASSSASSMWAANAATVSPAPDTRDRKLHLTPANLASALHRSLEAETTAAVLRAIFPDSTRVSHHDPLPSCLELGDEGAANHFRLCPSHGESAIEVFADGGGCDSSDPTPPDRFRARQSLAASRAIARLHGVEQALFVRQHPAAIAAGAFHSDVVAVANENVLIHHQTAFADGAVESIREAYRRHTRGEELQTIELVAAELPLAVAVDSYLFNSQLVTLGDGAMALVCPEECRETPAARAAVERILAASEGRIGAAHFVPLHQSMRNGGGPACLRLRVPMSDDDLAAAHHGVFFDGALEAALCSWIERHYRDSLSPRDLADPALLAESRAALDELTRILGLGSIYEFQRP